MKKYDAVMIGFGKGAKTLAAELAAKGESVAVVERDPKMYGGTCINVGCIPTKSLVRSARLSSERGGSFAEKKERYAAAIAEKDRLTAMLRKKNYDKLASLPTVDVIAGAARFTAPRELAVTTADGETRICGEKVFINTGSVAFVPPVPGLKESAHVYTSETLLDIAELPAELVIIGGGYIGLEFASIYANFGSKVTVVQDGADFVPREDRDVAAALLSIMSEKIDFIFSARTEAVRDENGRAVITVSVNGEKRELTADAVLVATGRRPNTAGLGLAAAGVETLPNGAVKTDAQLHTTADNVWAMGDCKGGPMFTYIGLDDYRIVSDALRGGERTTGSQGASVYSVFLDPPLGRVGLTEAEAHAAGYETAAAALPAAAIPKAQVLKKPQGLLKAVVDKKTGLILGASLLCEEAYEIINIVKLAMDAGLPYTALRDAVYTHPTMSEALNDLFAGIKL